MDETPKVAVITGGSRGIGKEISVRFAQEGMCVVIASRTQSQVDATVKEIREQGGDIIGFVIDVSDGSAVKDMISSIHDSYGPIDILINNAGAAYGGMPLWEDNPETWWRFMEINLKSALLMSHYALKDMVSRNSGTIINMSSFAGIRPLPTASAYGVSKTAMTRLGESIHTMLPKDSNVAIFNISPGLVYTDMTKDAPMFKNLPPEAWTPAETTVEVCMSLISGKYNALSGRFVHVTWDADKLLDEVNEITEKNLLILRLPDLDGLIE